MLFNPFDSRRKEIRNRWINQWTKQGMRWREAKRYSFIVDHADWLADRLILIPDRYERLRVLRDHQLAFWKGEVEWTSHKLKIIDATDWLEEHPDVHRLMCMGIEELRELAGEIATECLNALAYDPDANPIEAAIREAERRIERMQIPLPASWNKMSDLEKHARACNSDWWVKRLRQAKIKNHEAVAYRLGIIKKYSSRSGRQTAKMLEQQNLRWAKEAAVHLPDGKEIPMLDLLDQGKKNRLAYLLTMTKGLRDFQDAQKWDARLWTVTVPGCWRDTKTPEESLDHLRVILKNFAAWRYRNQSSLMGMTAFQPHKNGFAHVHLYTIGPTEELDAAAEFLREEALRVEPDEPGAQEHRFDEQKEDRQKGRLSSYISRYVLSDAVDAHPSVAAWFRAWRARKFSFFGLPASKNTWDALRQNRQGERPRDKLLREAMRAADIGNAGLFFAAMMKLKERGDEPESIRVERQSEQLLTPYWRYIGTVIRGATFTHSRATPGVIVMQNGPREASEEGGGGPSRGGRGDEHAENAGFSCDFEDFEFRAAA